MIFGTGGMSHQISGQRAGLINSKFDHAFLDNLTKDPKKLTRLSHLELMREAGAEGVEMVMWLIMRGALDDKVDEVYRFYTVPASNTAVGHIILENRKKARRSRRKIKRAAAARKSSAFAANVRHAGLSRRIRSGLRESGSPGQARHDVGENSRRGLHENLCRRPRRVWPEASRCVEAHPGRRSHLAGRRQPGLPPPRSPRNTACRITPAISAKASSAPTR